MSLTESVRSFQVPDTPLTLACPPRIPSVPTSRATRVTSEAKEPSRVTMVFTILADLRNWPRSFRPSSTGGTCWLRLPSATEPITRIISLIGLMRSLVSALLELTIFCHEPFIIGNSIRSSTLPCLPISRATRSNSVAVSAAMSMISLSVSAILPGMPVQSSGIRVVKSPLRNDFSAASNVFMSKTSIGVVTVAMSMSSQDGCHAQGVMQEPALQY
ncbi:hypothetical protein D3C86_862640 [compost metagenome]